jgi:hypothetical protein
MKFTAIITLALATLVAASPMELEKRKYPNNTSRSKKKGT